MAYARYAHMRRLYFRLIVPDGPLRRFRLAEDFGEERKPAEGSTSVRGAGMALAWCGFSAGCWLLAQGHLLPEISLEPLVALSQGTDSQTWAMAVVRPDADVISAFGQSAQNKQAAATSSAVSALPVGSSSTDVHLRSAASRLDLPKVSYTVSVTHQGGELAPPEQRAATSEVPGADSVSVVESELALVEPTRREQNLAPSRGETPVAARHTNVLPSDQGAGTSRATAGYDPFEDDFVPVRPTLSLPHRESTAAKPSVNEVSDRTNPERTEPQRGTPDLVEKRGINSGGAYVLHTGGGCQAAFAASNQVVNVGKGVVGTDATSEDYTVVLGRMNVVSCNPPGPLSVQVCVAVSERRAVGTTITTKPANAAVANCIARQVAGMRFPASTGADLVRTRVDIE